MLEVSQYGCPYRAASDDMCKICCVGCRNFILNLDDHARGVTARGHRRYRAYESPRSEFRGHETRFHPNGQLEMLDWGSSGRAGGNRDVGMIPRGFTFTVGLWVFT